MLVPHLMEIVEEDCLVYAITFHISSTEVNYSCQNIIQHDWLSSHQLSEWPWSLCSTHKPPVKTAVAASLVRVILKGIIWIGVSCDCENTFLSLFYVCVAKTNENSYVN